MLCPYGTPPLRGLPFSLSGHVQKMRSFENTLPPLALSCSSFHLRDADQIGWIDDGVPVVGQKNPGRKCKSLLLPHPRQSDRQPPEIAFLQRKAADLQDRSALRLLRLLLLNLHELHAAVVGAALRRIVRSHGLGLAKALGGEPIGTDAEFHQRPFHRFGAALREVEVLSREIGRAHV